MYDNLSQNTVALFLPNGKQPITTERHIQLGRGIEKKIIVILIIDLIIFDHRL